MDMQTQFQLAGGSVAGRNHRTGVPRNRQDDLCFSISPHAITAVVADGCGSSERSEVGASIAVRLLDTYLQSYLATQPVLDARGLRRAHKSLTAQLYVLASTMGPSFNDVVASCFLFTLLGVAITVERATFFALGDGLIVVNGKSFVLEPETGNRPLYIGYSLTGSTLTDQDASLLDFKVVQELPTAELENFLIGSDGINDFKPADRLLPGLDDPMGELCQFWTKDLFFTNPVAIERRLNLAARDWPRGQPSGTPLIEGGVLTDDTTLIVGRRKTQQPVET